MKPLLIITKFFLLLVFSSSLIAGAEFKHKNVFNEVKYRADIKKMLTKLTPDNQLSILKVKNIAPNGFKESIMAIHIIESSIGKYIVNVNKNGTLDCGKLHINTKTVSSIVGVKHNSWNMKMICSKLIEDDLYTMKKAEQILSFWKVKNKKSWLETWARYNGGSTPNWDYGKKVQIVIQELRTFLKEKNESTLEYKSFVEKINNLNEDESKSILLSLYNVHKLTKLKSNNLDLQIQNKF